MIFPLVGFGLCISGLMQNRKALYLLRFGRSTRGHMVSCQRTNTSINDDYVYAYEFEFEVGRKKYIAHCKTHLTEVVEDEEREIILYMDYNPSKNVVYDAMSGAPQITNDGRLVQSSVSAIKYLLIPIVGSGINALVAMAVFA